MVYSLMLKREHDKYGMRQFINLVENAQSKTSVESFIDDFESISTLDKADGGRVIDGTNVIVHVSKSRYNANAVFLDDMKTNTKGSGGGKKAIATIVSLADKHGVTIELLAKSFQEDGLTTPQLIEWYSRYGFVKTENGQNGSAFMERKPSVIGPVSEAFDKSHDDIRELVGDQMYGDSVEQYNVYRLDNNRLAIAKSEPIEEARNPKQIKQFRQEFNDRFINSDTHGESARSNPRWRKTLSSWMEEHGFNIIGSGINGAVYENPNYPYVIKVYRTDHAYDDWIWFSKTNPTNKYVPQVRGNVIRINGVFNAVRLEKLVPADTSRAIAFVHTIEELADANWAAGGKEKLDNADPDMRSIAKMIRDWEGSTDLTAHNVMMRSNGELVLIDPLYISPPGDIEIEDDLDEGYYHGSQEDAPNFIIGHQGNNSNFLGNYSSKRYGVFLSNNPKFAQQYGKVGKYEVDTVHILPPQGVRGLVDGFVDSLDPFGEDRGIWLEARNVQTGAWPLWRMFDDELGERFYEYAKDDYDAIEFEEDHDDEAEENGSVNSLTTVVLNPSVIKRVG